MASLPIIKHFQPLKDRCPCLLVGLEAVLDVSESGYYVWREGPEPARQRADRQLSQPISQIFRAGRGVYGVRGCMRRFASVVSAVVGNGWHG